MKVFKILSPMVLDRIGFDRIIFIIFPLGWNKGRMKVLKHFLLFVWIECEIGID